MESTGSSHGVLVDPGLLPNFIEEGVNLESSPILSFFVILPGVRLESTWSPPGVPGVYLEST